MKFTVAIEGYIELDIDPEVIEQVDDEWRSRFYDLETTDEIVGFLARNIFLGRLLSSIDGFANLSDDQAKVLGKDNERMEVMEPF
jgi:hypothetical protein